MKRISTEEAFNLTTPGKGSRRGRKRGRKSHWRLFADQKKQDQDAALENLARYAGATGPTSPGGTWKEHSQEDRSYYDTTPFPIMEESSHDFIDYNGPNDEHAKQFLIDEGFLHVEEDADGGGHREKHGPHHDLYQMVPEEVRDNIRRMMDPLQRKKMLGDIYRTRVFIASYWMLAILFVLLFLPESKFFAPFIAGYVGGRKAGSVWKGVAAAMVPFVILGLLDVLVYYNIIYHFYDLYLPSAGLFSQNLTQVLMNYGLDPSGMEGSFYDPGTSLSRCFIYLIISAIIGGTLEADKRDFNKKFGEWLSGLNISHQVVKRKVELK